MIEKLFQKMFVLIAATVILLFPMSIQIASACACCDTHRVTNVEKGDQLNVRSGPGVKYKRVGWLHHNESCIYKTTHCKGKWCRIEFGSLKGWVHTHYLEPVKQ